jgi:hypothetical protein
MPVEEPSTASSTDIAGDWPLGQHNGQSCRTELLSDLVFDWHGSDYIDERTGHGVSELAKVDKAEITLEFSSVDVVRQNALRIADD